jgi:hypothetical protein
MWLYGKKPFPEGYAKGLTIIFARMFVAPAIMIGLCWGWSLDPILSKCAVVIASIPISQVRRVTSTHLFVSFLQLCKNKCVYSMRSSTISLFSNFFLIPPLIYNPHHSDTPAQASFSIAREYNIGTDMIGTQIGVGCVLLLPVTLMWMRIADEVWGPTPYV